MVNKIQKIQNALVGKTIKQVIINTDIIDDLENTQIRIFFEDETELEIVGLDVGYGLE